MTHRRDEIVKAIKAQAKQQLPYGLSRLVMSAALIVNGFILNKLDNQNNTNNMVAAGSLISAIQFVLLGVGRGYLLTTGLKVSDLYGQLKIQEGCDDKMNNLPDEFNQAITQSNAVALFICLLEIPVCWLTTDLVKQCNVNHAIADNIGNYFKPFSYGLAAYYLLLIDNQIALAKQKSNITLYSGILFSLIWLVSSYSLALGVGGIPAMSIAGIGMGFSISSVINCVILHLYLSINHYKSFNPFPFNSENFLLGFRQQMKDGTKLALQRISEWGNMALVAFVFGSFGEDYLIAQQPPLQLTYMVTTTTLAMIQAQATLVRKTLSKSRLQLTNNEYDHSCETYKKAILLGNMGMVTGILISCAISALIVTAHQPLAQVFIDDDQLREADINLLCKNLFTISGITIFLDSIRNYSTGALRGMNELTYPPIISAATMFSAIIMGVVLCHYDIIQPQSLYIMRAAGILIAAGLIMRQWNLQSRSHYTMMKKEFKNDEVVGGGQSAHHYMTFSSANRVNVECGLNTVEDLFDDNAESRSQYV
jgi:Na+-driven multidrug efflux pump